MVRGTGTPQGTCEGPFTSGANKGGSNVSSQTNAGQNERTEAPRKTSLRVWDSYQALGQNHFPGNANIFVFGKGEGILRRAKAKTCGLWTTTAARVRGPVREASNAATETSFSDLWGAPPRKIPAGAETGSSLRAKVSYYAWQRGLFYFPRKRLRQHSHLLCSALKQPREALWYTGTDMCL